MDINNGISVTVKELLSYQRCFLKKVPPKKSLAQQAGQHTSSFRGRGMDFSEVRNYQAGDDIRQMEWRVTARTGKAHVKLYHEEKERSVFIVTDFNPSMFFGSRVAYKSVIASRFAAMLGFAASHNGDKVGGIAFSGDASNDIRPRARKQGILPLVQALSQFSICPSKSVEQLERVLAQLRHIVKPGALIFILSDFENIGGATDAYLQRLSLRADIISYMISDPLERKAPAPAHYAITNGVNEAIFDTTSTDVQKLYQQHYQEKLFKMQKIMKAGKLIELSTDDDLEQHLQGAFLSAFARRT